MKIKVTRRNCFLSALSTWRVCVVFGFRVEHWKLDFYEGYTTRTLPSILECNKSIFLLSIMGSCAGKPNLSDFLWRERFFCLRFCCTYPFHGCVYFNMFAVAFFVISTSYPDVLSFNFHLFPHLFLLLPCFFYLLQDVYKFHGNLPRYTRLLACHVITTPGGLAL